MGMNRSITEAEFLRSKDARRLTNPQKKPHPQIVEPFQNIAPE